MNIKNKLREKLLFEEVETINNANKGDYIVKNPTGEEYVLTPSKFKKNYNQKELSNIDKDGYIEYKNKSEVRDVIKITELLGDKLKDKFGKTTPTQEDFYSFISKFKTRKAEKDVIVKARVVTEKEEVVTITKKESDVKPIIKFIASWDETMIVKKDDIIVILDDEAYRIGKYEFEKTYKFIKT